MRSSMLRGLLKKVFRGQPQPNGSLKTKRQPKFPQIFLTGVSTKVIELFLSADIPLYKLNSPELKKVLQVWDNLFRPKICDRRKVNELFATELERVKSQLSDTEVFLVCHSSEITYHQYLIF